MAEPSVTYYRWSSSLPLPLLGGITVIGYWQGHPWPVPDCPLVTDLPLRSHFWMGRTQTMPLLLLRCQNTPWCYCITITLQHHTPAPQYSSATLYFFIPIFNSTQKILSKHSTVDWSTPPSSLGCHQDAFDRKILMIAIICSWMEVLAKSQSKSPQY